MSGLLDRSLPEDSSPEMFLDTLRGVAREVRGSNQIVLVLEGGGDRHALAIRLSDWVTVVVAEGKEKLIAGYQQLEAQHRDQMVFVIDCDGQIDLSLKGHVDLVLTTHRDVEADFVFTPGVLGRVIQRYLPPAASVGAARALAERFAHRVTIVALRVSAIVLAAGLEGKNVHLGPKGARRKVDASELVDAIDWDADDPAPLADLLAEATSKLSWGMQDSEAIRIRAQALLDAICRRHEVGGCEPCTRASVVVGHQAVSATITLLKRLDASLGNNEVSNLIYATPSMDDLKSWEVGRRLDEWAELAGLELWA